MISIKDDMTLGMQGYEEAPKLLEELILKGENAGASDIHLLMQEDRIDVKFRMDGQMTPYMALPRGVGERVFGRVKFLAGMRTYQESYPQEGRIAKNQVGASQDVRVSTYPTVTGEKLNLRLFTVPVSKSLAELGLPKQVYRDLERVLRQNTGLVLLTGPAGSGKTTTIYACLAHLAETQRHVITVEDPVEQLVPGIMQTEVNEACGLDFPQAVRHLLRDDPDSLVIGEIRDEETAGMAVRIALTGHLVIATFHAGSCQGVFQRLKTMTSHFPMAVSATQLVLNQRLIRRLCANCEGEGCQKCLQTGHRGRVPVAEALPLTDSLRVRVCEGQTTAAVPDRTLKEQGDELLKRGIVDERELERAISYEIR